MDIVMKIKLLNHTWTIRFIPKHLTRESDDGTCWTAKKCIDIDNSLDSVETKLILTHELVHAFLGMGGRAYEENISQESVCEFIAWNIDDIIKARDKILEEANIKC